MHKLGAKDEKELMELHFTGVITISCDKYKLIWLIDGWAKYPYLSNLLLSSGQIIPFFKKFSFKQIVQKNTVVGSL